jgi:hypothetical protein
LEASSHLAPNVRHYLARCRAAIGCCRGISDFGYSGSGTEPQIGGRCRDVWRRAGLDSGRRSALCGIVAFSIVIDAKSCEICGDLSD